MINERVQYCQCLSVVGWGWFWFVLGILGHAFVLDISHITGVGIAHTVGDNLSAAIGEGDTVRPVSGVPVSVLVLAKVCS